MNAAAVGLADKTEVNAHHKINALEASILYLQECFAFHSAVSLKISLDKINGTFRIRKTDFIS